MIKIRPTTATAPKMSDHIKAAAALLAAFAMIFVFMIALTSNQ